MTDFEYGMIEAVVNFSFAFVSFWIGYWAGISRDRIDNDPDQGDSHRYHD